MMRFIICTGIIRALPAKAIAQDPPQEDDGQHRPGKNGITTDGIEFWKTGAQFLRYQQEQQDGDKQDKAGIVLESSADAKVQQLMQGPLGAASGAFQPGQRVKRTTGEENFRRIERIVYDNAQDNSYQDN